MKLRTELISEIRTLAVTFTAGDQLRDWIEEVSDQAIQEVLGSRVRTIASAMTRLEAFMVDYGYDDARGDDYEAQAILNEAVEVFAFGKGENVYSGPADTSGAKTSAEIAFDVLDAQEADREDFDSETFNDGEDDEEDGVDPKRMAEKLRKARARYEPTVAYTGRLSSNTGDELSVFLAGMSPREVCTMADWVCLEENGGLISDFHHWHKYEHLNPGSIRMNAGNKIRSRVKSGLITVAGLQGYLKSGF